MNEALKTWRDKLEHLLVEEAIESEAAAKFKLQYHINEAKAKIAELEATIRPATAQAGERVDSPRVDEYLSGQLTGQESFNGTTSSPAAAGDMPPPGGSSEGLNSRQAQRVIESLSAEAAHPFLRQLAHEINNQHLRTASQIAGHFTGCGPEDVQELFYVVRRALSDMPVPASDVVGRMAAERAAIALWFLAASRTVNKAALANGGYVYQAPSDEGLICAIIANALLGGELHISPGEQPGVPRAPFVFQVKPAPDGDWMEQSFERAVFLAVLPDHRDAPAVGELSGPLSKTQRASLAARLRTIQNVQRTTLALVVQGVTEKQTVRGFAEKQQVPVMLPCEELSDALLGMEAEALLAELGEFWNELKMLPTEPLTAGPSTDSGVAMQKSASNVNINVTGNPTIAVEPERRDDEGPQHEVTLSEGSWLADTTCTQAQWQALMGENPSHFQGDEQRPVEQVSWGDVQKFLRKLEGRLPGCRVGLPSEAEWEYACRAGTTTPFSFDCHITPEQVNYDGNYPYADGTKGTYRKTTKRLSR